MMRREDAAVGIHAGVIAVVGAALLCLPANVFGQSCSGGSDASMRACNAEIQSMEILQARMGGAATAGNPIPGASSTLGMRIGSIPRVSVAGRFTAMRGGSNARSVNIDAAVGVFSGFTLVPTIGGFGSIDAVASAGKLSVPDHLSSDNPATWAVGVRLGLLRESFTAPGVSVTAMYRRIGDVGVSLAVPSGPSSSQSLTDNTVWSVRGVVGKRLFVLGANVGVGFDRYSSELQAAAVSCAGVACLGQLPATFTDDDFKETRKTIFANLTWTLLIINGVIEGGWQEGGEAFTASLPAGQSSRTDKTGYYGSLAIRLAL